MNLILGCAAVFLITKGNNIMHDSDRSKGLVVGIIGLLLATAMFLRE